MVQFEIHRRKIKPPRQSNFLSTNRCRNTNPKEKSPCGGRNTLSPRRKLNQFHFITLIAYGTGDISRQFDNALSVLTVKISRFPLCLAPCLEPLNLNCPKLAGRDF